MADTLPDLVEAIHARATTALEQRLKLRWRRTEHKRWHDDKPSARRPRPTSLRTATIHVKAGFGPAATWKSGAGCDLDVARGYARVLATLRASTTLRISSQSMSLKLCIGQNFGPHIEQNSADLK